MEKNCHGFISKSNTKIKINFVTNQSDREPAMVEITEQMYVLRYAYFKHSDWLLKMFQPIR